MDRFEQLLDNWGCRTSATNRAAVLVPRVVLERLASLALERCILDADAYLELNPDVKPAIGDGTTLSALQHMIWHGIREGRPLPDGKVDGDAYGKRNPDLMKNGLTTKAELENHWLAVGWMEGRSRA